MSADAPSSAALQTLDAAARILLDAAAVAAQEHRARIPAPVTPGADQAGFALQAVLRQAHNDHFRDEDLYEALAASVAMFIGNQRLTSDVLHFLGSFNTAVVRKLPVRPVGTPRPN